MEREIEKEQTERALREMREKLVRLDQEKEGVLGEMSILEHISKEIDKENRREGKILKIYLAELHLNEDRC